MLVRHRLLDRGDADRGQLEDAPGCLVGRERLVRVDAQVHLSAGATADGPQSRNVIVAGNAHLDLEVVEAEEALRPARHAQLEPARRGDGATVAHPGPWSMA